MQRIEVGAKETGREAPEGHRANTGRAEKLVNGQDIAFSLTGRSRAQRCRRA